MRTWTLGQSSIASVAADRVVAVNNSSSILVQTSNQVESVVREESSRVEGFGEQMCDGFSGGLPLDFEVVNFKLGLDDLHQHTLTLVSSQKSANIPDVASTVLSVSCTSLLSVLVTMLYPSDSLESPPTTTKSAPAMATTVPPLLT